jgi:hypothetical protein
MDARTALERLHRLVFALEDNLPGPDILSTTPVEDLGAEIVGAFRDFERALGAGGPDVAARTVDHQTTAVAIAGVDIYVRDTPNAVIVGVGTEDLARHKTAWIESFDGTSWEQQLP